MWNRTTQTAFLLLFVAAVQAEDLETSHAFNVNFELAPKWSLLLHTRVRTFQDAHSFYQARGGPIETWQALPRLSVLSGYYYIDQNTRLSKAYTLHRMWGGGQYRVINASRWSLDGRGVYERFISEQFLDYTRLLRFKMPGSPLAQPYRGSGSRLWARPAGSAGWRF